MTKKKVTLLTRDAILKADDLKIEDVQVPEWGGVIRVRNLTGSERDEYESGLIVGKGRERDVTFKNARARMVFLSAIDEDGKRLFTHPSDVEKLGSKNAAALDRVFGVCQKLSALTTKDMEEMVGNSETAPSGGSTTD